MGVTKGIGCVFGLGVCYWFGGMCNGVMVGAMVLGGVRVCRGRLFNEGGVRRKVSGGVERCLRREGL